MTEHSLPLWAGNGMHPTGAAHEALGFDGRPLPDELSRVRVQARQLYCFALAHTLGWDARRAAGLVAGLLPVLTGSCRRSDGTYGRSIRLDELKLEDDTPDLYDNAFALLALATARDAAGDDAPDRHIDNLLDALDASLADTGRGGFREVVPAPDYRLQNPHMHLFEALLAVYAASDDGKVRQRIDTLGKFIEATFFDYDEGCVNEYGASNAPEHRGWFEPGHSMEWVWLLGWRARLFGEAYPAFGRQLYARALNTLDASGRAVMKVAFDGEPLDSSRRLWSQTETLKAHLCMMEQEDGAARQRAAQSAADCAGGIYGEWLLPATAGGWHDHFDLNGRLLAPHMPASSGYHVYCSIAELIRLT